MTRYFGIGDSLGKVEAHRLRFAGKRAYMAPVLVILSKFVCILRIFQNSVSFEKPLAFYRVSCVPQEKPRKVRNLKVAFSRVFRLLKKPLLKELPYST
jgi:hypothetical protein